LIGKFEINAKFTRLKILNLVQILLEEESEVISRTPTGFSIGLSTRENLQGLFKIPNKFFVKRNLWSS
jgi:hypothetical protein